MPICRGELSPHCEVGVLVNSLTSLKTCPALHSQLLRFMRRIYLNPVTLSQPWLITSVMMVLFVLWCKHRIFDKQSLIQLIIETAHRTPASLGGIMGPSPPFPGVVFFCSQEVQMCDDMCHE